MGSATCKAVPVSRQLNCQSALAHSLPELLCCAVLCCRPLAHLALGTRTDVCPRNLQHGMPILQAQA